MQLEAATSRRWELPPQIQPADRWVCGMVIGENIMEKILAKLRVKNDEFRGVFNPEELAMMKRVFDQVCREKSIRLEDLEHRESIALVILRATKGQIDESELLYNARQAAKTTIE
jgi:hypothetical protein